MKLFTASLGGVGSVIEPPVSSSPGLVVSFDDIYTTDWVTYHDTHGKQRGWKASFMTYSGNDTQMGQLKYLYDEGHEINNHTKNGFSDPEIYINTGSNTPQDYYYEYVKPMEDRAIEFGIPKPTCFRFPRNRLSYDCIDDLFTNRGYKIISPASRAPFENPITDSNYFYNFDRFPIAIDFASVGTIAEYQTLMDYALANNLVLNIFAHGVLNYATKMNAIIDHANYIGLPMLHMSEMYDIQGSIPDDNESPTIGTLVQESLSSTQVVVSCTASDNIKVVGWDIWENGLNLYPWYSSELQNRPLSVTSGQSYTFEVTAFDRQGNRSPKSNTISFTAP